jgi:hypothetical protein
MIDVVLARAHALLSSEPAVELEQFPALEE